MPFGYCSKYNVFFMDLPVSSLHSPLLIAKSVDSVVTRDGSFAQRKLSVFL